MYDSSATNSVRCLKGGCNVNKMESTDLNGEIVCLDCNDNCKYCEQPNGAVTPTCLDQQCDKKFGLTSTYTCDSKFPNIYAFQRFM